MIVYLSNKTRFRADILFNRIEEIVHESFQGALGKTVGASDVFRVPALAIWSDDTLVVRTKKWATGVSPLPNLAELPDHFIAKPGFFLTQVVVESMNRRIPNGSWCIFREPSDGSRNGKVVIVQSRDIQESAFFSVNFCTLTPFPQRPPGEHRALERRGHAACG